MCSYITKCYKVEGNAAFSLQSEYNNSTCMHNNNNSLSYFYQQSQAQFIQNDQCTSIIYTEEGVAL